MDAHFWHIPPGFHEREVSCLRAGWILTLRGPDMVSRLSIITPICTCRAPTPHLFFICKLRRTPTASNKPKVPFPCCLVSNTFKMRGAPRSSFLHPPFSWLTTDLLATSTTDDFNQPEKASSPNSLLSHSSQHWPSTTFRFDSLCPRMSRKGKHLLAPSPVTVFHAPLLHYLNLSQRFIPGSCPADTL